MMSQKPQQPDTQKMLAVLKIYRDALEAIAKHDGINSAAVSGPQLAKIAKQALEARSEVK